MCLDSFKHNKLIQTTIYLCVEIGFSNMFSQFLLGVLYYSMVFSSEMSGSVVFMCVCSPGQTILDWDLKPFPYDWNLSKAKDFAKIYLLDSIIPHFRSLPLSTFLSLILRWEWMDSIRMTFYLFIGRNCWLQLNISFNRGILLSRSIKIIQNVQK